MTVDENESCRATQPEKAAEEGAAVAAEDEREVVDVCERAGDRVNMIAAFNSTNAATGSGTPTLEWLVRGIRIMQNTGSSVILETTDTQGARLAFAADNAKLWFLLRPPVGAKNSKDFGSSINQQTLREFEISVTSQETEDGETFTITGSAEGE